MAGEIKIDHPDPVFCHLSLLKAVGSTDSDFLYGLTNQLANAGSKGPAPDESGMSFMLAAVKGIEPRDQTEAGRPDGRRSYGLDDIRPPPGAHRDHPAAGQRLECLQQA
jgi:hypothetical protein